MQITGDSPDFSLAEPVAPGRHGGSVNALIQNPEAGCHAKPLPGEVGRWNWDGQIRDRKAVPITCLAVTLGAVCLEDFGAKCGVAVAGDWLDFAEALDDVVSAGIKQKLADYDTKPEAERCCMPLASRQSDRSAKYFLGTSGRGYWK